MKKILFIFLAVTLAISFAYVIDAEAQCGLMGGGGGQGCMGGSGGGCMRGGGMSGMGAMKGGCRGCMCGGACGTPGCMCAGGMSGMGSMKGACGNPGCPCGAACAGPGCMCGGGMGGMRMPMMGRQPMGSGMMNPMMKVFLDETKDLRKQLMDKRFEYAEAARNFDIPVEELMKMEKEIRILQMKINRFWLK